MAKLRVRCVVTVELDVAEERLADGRIQLTAVQLPHLQDAGRGRRTAEKYLRRHVQAWARRMLAIRPARAAEPPFT